MHNVRRKAEIADTIRNARIGQIRRLLKHRSLIPLPDDDRSRRYVQALLGIGMNRTTVSILAPWMPVSELDQAMDKAVLSGSAQWTARRLGDRFEVTYAEKLNRELNLRNLECFECDRGVIQEAMEARRRIDDAKRKRIARAEKKATLIANSVVDERMEAIYAALTNNWISVTQLMADIGKYPVWKRPDGRLLTGRSLRRAINREIDQLGARIEFETRPGPRGLPMRHVRRR